MSFPGENKLTLNNKMRPSYLIQRLHKPAPWVIGGKAIDNPFSFGGGLKNGGLSDKAMDLIRGIFSFDYMGSSEFEWGAVPQALQFLAEQASKQNLIDGKVEFTPTEIVYYLAPIDYVAEVENRIRLLRKDEYAFRLQERCGLADYFDPMYAYSKDNVGWLELDNGFAFFTDKEMFDKTCKLFGIEP